jgi:hypothetical protein
LAPEELRQINFQAINFQEYYVDITAEVPDPTLLIEQSQKSQALVPQPGNASSAPPTISQGQTQQDLNNFFGTHVP